MVPTFLRALCHEIREYAFRLKAVREYAFRPKAVVRGARLSIHVPITAGTRGKGSVLPGDMELVCNIIKVANGSERFAFADPRFSARVFY
jgi:hypothetical protein